MSYTDVFGGELLFPSITSYNSITTAISVTLQWAREQQIEGINVVADWMDIDATAVSLNIDMPSASSVSTGNKVTFNNIGANTYTVRDSTGGTIQSIAPGEQWVLILTDNSTAAGTWITSQLGATVSVASASALAGAGIKAITTTLNQKIDSDVEAATPFTVVDGDRAKCLIYTAGAGTANLPTAGTVGDDWFFMLRNSGSGTLNVLPPAGQIDGGASINLDPNDSAFIFTDGTDFFTVGLSTGSTIAFDFVSIAVPGSGDFVLSGANLDRISYRFTGALTGNRRIVVPNTTQQYWVDNQTSGAFTLEIDTVAGAGQVITQGQSAIVYCDATDVINAVSSTSVAFPITIGQGGTGGTTVLAAQTNLQVPPVGRLFSAGVGIDAAGLGDLSADRTIAALAATESVVGSAEVATQAETDTGTDDTRVITPLKLANFAGLSNQKIWTYGQTATVSVNNSSALVTMTGLLHDSALIDTTKLYSVLYFGYIQQSALNADCRLAASYGGSFISGQAYLLNFNNPGGIGTGVLQDAVEASFDVIGFFDTANSDENFVMRFDRFDPTTQGDIEMQFAQGVPVVGDTSAREGTMIVFENEN